MSDSVNTVKVILKGDDQLTPVVDRATANAEAKFQKATAKRYSSRADDGTNFYGPAVRSRFDAQEQQIRDQVAGRIRALRDQARRASIAEEVDRRLFGEKPKQFGPQTQVSTVATGQAPQTGPLYQNIVDKLGGAAATARGAGFVAAFVAVERLSASLVKAREESQLLGKTSGEVAEGFIRSIPVISRIYDAGRSIRELFTGEELHIKFVQREAEIQQDVNDIIAKRIELIRASQREADRAVRQARLSAQARQNPLDAENIIAGGNAREEIIAEQQRLADLKRDISAGEGGKLDELRKQRQDLLNSITDGGRNKQGLITKDQEALLATLNNSIARLESTRSKFGDITAASNTKVAAISAAEYARIRSRIEGDPVQRVAEERQRSLGAGYVRDETLAADVRRSRQSSIDLLSDSGSQRTAAKASIQADLEQRLALLKVGHDRELQDGVTRGEQLRAVEERYQSERQRLISDANRQIQILNNQYRREDIQAERDHKSAVLATQTQAAEVRLRTAGRTVDAERLAVKEQLREQLEAIEKQRQAELAAHAEQSADINRRAAQSVAAARELADANLAAIFSQGGPDVNRGFVGGEGRLGRRLSSSDTFVAPPRAVTPEQITRIENAMKSVDQNIKSLLDRLPQVISGAISGALTPAQ